MSVEFKTVIESFQDDSLAQDLFTWYPTVSVSIVREHSILSNQSLETNYADDVVFMDEEKQP